MPRRPPTPESLTSTLIMATPKMRGELSGEAHVVVETTLISFSSAPVSHACEEGNNGQWSMLARQKASESFWAQAVKKKMTLTLLLCAMVRQPF